MHEKGRVLVTGASGLIGSELAKVLVAKGYCLVVLGRGAQRDFTAKFTVPCDYFQWSSPTTTPPPPEALDVDFVIHLMGEGIATKRWSNTQKQKLRDSRVLTTKNLAQALHHHRPNLTAFISASATGIYGDREDTLLDETSTAADDFLANICRDWEAEANKAPGRRVQIRIGLVLTPRGGVLEKMLPVFRLGLGAQLSDGRQWMSWIHIEDLVRIFVEAIENPKLSGPCNAVAPNPIRNGEFSNRLAERLKRPCLLRVPECVLRAALGEMSRFALFSQRIKPAHLTQSDFNFKFAQLDDALRDLLREQSLDRSVHD